MSATSNVAPATSACLRSDRISPQTRPFPDFPSRPSPGIIGWTRQHSGREARQKPSTLSLRWRKLPPGSVSLNRAALVAAFPCRASLSLEPIDSARVSTSQSLHQQSQACRVLAGIDDQIDVVRHQAIGVDLQPQLLPELLQGCKVRQPVFVRNEHRSAIVTALHHVVGHVGE